MARVMAHEVYHFLLQTHHHGKKGISQPALTPGALLNPQLRFEDVELEKLRSENRNAPGGLPAQSFLK